MSEDPDGIQPACLKHMGPNTKSAVLSLFNKIIEQNWPSENNVVIFPPKAVKECHLYTSCYRPITKSSYVGKLLEKVIKNIILEIPNENSLEDQRQEGFGKQVNCAIFYGVNCSHTGSAQSRSNSNGSHGGQGKRFRQCLDKWATFEDIPTERQRILVKVVESFLCNRELRIRLADYTVEIFSHWSTCLKVQFSHQYFLSSSRRTCAESVLAKISCLPTI